MDHGQLAWRKSSASGEGNCVEVAIDGGHVLVRDTKDPGGTVLEVDAAEWPAFLAGVRGGELG